MNDVDNGELNEQENMLAYTAIPERQLSFAGSDPVAYDDQDSSVYKAMNFLGRKTEDDQEREHQELMENSNLTVDVDVIREVTEPTSPDPYFPDGKKFVPSISSSPALSIMQYPQA